MHFGLTDEQTELASTLRTLLAKRSDSRAVRAAVEQPRGFDEDLWKVLCTQVGVAALAPRLPAQQAHQHQHGAQQQQ